MWLVHKREKGRGMQMTAGKGEVALLHEAEERMRSLILMWSCVSLLSCERSATAVPQPLPNPPGFHFGFRNHVLLAVHLAALPVWARYVDGHWQTPDGPDRRAWGQDATQRWVLFRIQRESSVIYVLNLQTQQRLNPSKSHFDKWSIFKNHLKACGYATNFHMFFLYSWNNFIE